MILKHLLKLQHNIDVKVSAGNGQRETPYVIEPCSASEAALTQVHLLRGISLGLGALLRIDAWEPCDLGQANEVIRYTTVKFTESQILTDKIRIYFDTRQVIGTPFSLHPLISWSGPPGCPQLPYELGWLHFDATIDNSSVLGRFDHSIFYSGFDSKASVYVYEKPEADTDDRQGAELNRAVEQVLAMDPALKDPWPIVKAGPFAMKYFLAAKDMTAVGVAISGPYFIKVRMTYFDDLKMREMMSSTLNALVAQVALAATEKH